ncbi:hypothetical protein NJBCHELONAE_47820 [Mycobacteroides chelonae]|nr:hypothetical protein NJBCHELONAE_47820 [Mycobacteroides chelonae]
METADGSVVGDAGRSPFDAAYAAFLAGDGRAEDLVAGVRGTEFVVPLDADGKVFTVMSGGLPWLPVFTSTDALHVFLAETGRDWRQVSAGQVPGGVIVDELLDRAPVPTGLMVDAGGSAPFAFPPVKELTPHCYVDPDTETIVMASAGLVASDDREA